MASERSFLRETAAAMLLGSAEAGIGRFLKASLCRAAIATGLMLLHAGPLLAAELLTWAPPPLTDPIVVKITDGKSYYGPFPNQKDVILRMPNVPITNRVKVVGGHNLRLIGGCIRPADGVAFVLRFVEVSGSVFIEGVEIDGKNLAGDGINVSGKKGFVPGVYIQNVRVVNINGFSAGEHADMFQAQGDIGKLRIDHLTGTSNYQGLFLRPEFLITSATIKNVNLRFLPNPHHQVTYLLWMRDSEDSTKEYPVSLESVYIEPRPGQTVAGQAVFPSERSKRAKAVEKDGKVTWPPGSLIEGCVLSGKPAAGDFVPQRGAAVTYVAPGYKSISGENRGHIGPDNRKSEWDPRKPTP
jgi:hypothetical protein